MDVVEGATPTAWYQGYREADLVEARSMMRHCNNTLTTTDILAYMEKAKPYFQAMGVPKQLEFDYQRCDPNHSGPGYSVMIRVYIQDKDLETVWGRITQPPDLGSLPAGAYLMVKTVYYALFQQSGKAKTPPWRRPGGYVFIPGQDKPLGVCPPGLIEVVPPFDMNMNTLNMMQNIRDHVRKMEEDGIPFNTDRSLRACDRDVPKSRQTPQKVSTNSMSPPSSGEGGIGRSPRKKRGAVDSNFTTPSKTNAGPTPRKKKVKRKVKRVEDGLTRADKNIRDFGLLCWEKFGQGRDYKKVKKAEYKHVVDTLPVPGDNMIMGVPDTRGPFDKAVRAVIDTLETYSSVTDLLKRFLRKKKQNPQLSLKDILK